MYQKKHITIQNQLGLHARAAAKLVKLSARFESEITLRLNDVQVNAKSIMGLLMLGASKNAQLLLEATGYDSADAIHALTELVDNRFGEE